MSWFTKSLTGLLGDADDEFRNEDNVRNEQEPNKSVREDLSELGRQLWGFLAPPPQVRQESAENPEDDTVELHLMEDPEEDKGSRTQDQAEAEESNSPTQKLAGLQSDLAELKGGFAKGLSRLSSVIRVVAGEDTDNSDARSLKEDQGEEPVDDKQSLPARIVSGIDGISKLASSIFPFVQEDDAEELWEAPGITDDVVAFATNVSMHPETWLDFPHVSGDENRDGFEMNGAQKEHSDAVQFAVSRLEALRRELCPEHMSEGRFWNIYFVLLHSRLSEQDAALLSTPQVLEARKVLLDHLKKRESPDETGGHVLEVDESSVVDKDAIESTIKLAATTSLQSTEGEEAEAEADEWLESDPGLEAAQKEANSAAAVSNRADDEEDISFSDLEDEEDASSSRKVLGEQASGGGNNRASQDWVQLDSSRSSNNGDEAKKHERAGSNDWLTVDQEDAASAATAAGS